MGLVQAKKVIAGFEHCIKEEECSKCPLADVHAKGWGSCSQLAIDTLKSLIEECELLRAAAREAENPSAEILRFAQDDKSFGAKQITLPADSYTSSVPAGHLPLKGKANEREDTSSTADERDDTVRRCAEYVAEKHLQMDEELPKKHKTKVICISGKAQHGKDTTAHFIKEYLEEHGKSVLIMHYSDLLKFIVRTYFGWNGEKDKDGRALLQYVGTDVIRRQSPDYWTDFAVGLIRMFPDEWDYVILADCRFPNEVECFKKSEFDTCHVRVIRAPFASPLTPEQQLHTSETALDAIGADRYLLNTGTLEEYRKTVCTWLTYRAAMNREG